MTIQLLGTGAADGIPALFSESEVSRYAREHGGKDIRTRSAAIIDGSLKIDLPPDTLTQIQRERLNPSNWSAIVFTHSHDDHFSVSELQYALYPFSANEFMPYTIYGNRTICDKIEAAYPDWPIEAIETRSFNCFRHGEYTITPFKAKHKSDEDSQNLIIQRDDKVVAYATDTGFWEAETWKFLEDYKFDALIIECTEGFNRTDYDGHLDITECVQVVERLRQMGTLKSGARVVTTHHSHLGGAIHARLEQALSQHGIEAGYDGMYITI